MNFVTGLFVRASYSRLRSFVTKSKGQGKVEGESVKKKGNGLANKRVFLTINLHFVKPSISHFKVGSVYPSLTRSDLQRPCFLMNLSFTPKYFAIVHPAARMLCKP